MLTHLPIGAVVSAYKKFSKHPDVRYPSLRISHEQEEEPAVKKDAANSEEEKRVGNMFYNNGQVRRCSSLDRLISRSLQRPSIITRAPYAVRPRQITCCTITALKHVRADPLFAKPDGIITDIRIEQYQRALEDLEKAVQLAPTSVKALIRKVRSSL